MAKFERTDDRTVKLYGRLDGPSAEQLMETVAAENTHTLDFDEVSEVNFAAMRVLLRNRRSGLLFTIINTSSAVAEKFEDTGVAVFINVCRKPKALDTSKYEEFGGGYASKAFNSEDGDSVLKVYGERVPAWFVAHEKTNSRSVMVFGIPTPLVGSLYAGNGQNGLEFERIEGKHSLSRLISNNPERLEEITVKFSQMCKELHSTECDTLIFPNRKEVYRMSVSRCNDITESEKARILSFLDSVPDAKTCIHGDMQPSNIITNGKDYLWIDLADFSWGNPMFDIGMLYFLSNLNPEENCQNIFHLSADAMKRIWNIFAREYFGADTPEKLSETNRLVEPYAALHMVYLGVTYSSFEPGMLPYIKEVFKEK